MHSNIKYLLIGMLYFGYSVSASAESELNSFEFPSKIMKVPSSSGALIASYADPGADEDGVHNYRFSILNSKRQELAGFTFLRSVDGSWYDSSDRLFVNNYIGSNTTDCFFLKIKGIQVNLQSLTGVLVSRKGSGPVGVSGIKPPENPNNSHYYLRCDGWIGKDLLRVTLTGTTDAGGYFKYNFIFDLNKEKFGLP
jgi:hypothetical protein